MFAHSKKLLAAGLTALLSLIALPLMAQGPDALQPAQPKAAPAEAASAALPPTTGQPSGGAQIEAQDLNVWLDGFMPYALARGDIAGAVVVVVKDGQIVTQRGFGYSDVAARKPVDPATTMFRPGSVSKLFAWTAVMQMVEQGKIDLDADVNKYLDFKIPPRDGKPITMRNIMTHTPGFEERFRNLIVDKWEVRPVGEMLKKWVPHRIYAPGSTPAYSNYATALAGYVVERVSGVPFDDYIQRNIFDRLGMAHSTVRQPLPAALQPFMSKGYALASGEPKPYELVTLAPAGSGAASGVDMARFMIAHLNQGGALMKPETARLMHDYRQEVIPGLNRHALGFWEQKINGRTTIGHGGDTAWFHSYLWLFPNENVGMFMSINSSGKDGVSGPLRTALIEGFADRYFPEPKPAPVALSTAREHARMMTGTYTGSRRPSSSFFDFMNLMGQVKISVNDKGELQVPAVTNLAGEPRKWVEVEPFVWESMDGNERIGGKVENGKVVRWTFSSFGPIMVFDRTPWYRSSSWLMPVLIVSMVIVLLTALSWPVGAIARRRYGATLALQGTDRKRYRLLRAAAWLVVLVPVGWMLLLSGGLEGGGGLTAMFLLLQILGAIGFVGLFALALWNAWRVLKSDSGWFAKLWSVLLAVAGFFILWVALFFHLIGLATEF
ncbi:serine hydrolase domain-containing protein [Sphingosinicella rhizophila]|uniref:Serine hydrolase domain-containing protein n=1 Tax=Sphingosinicella rhizophila TaxID=3050082 RepID=A0ABU3Q453_9SPHN|nr:serine hydrolase domain-containing protein [Sphingosinicella sp. GR2756]MDT9598201.1 serine hydrolase domain-containing protein [Sphingosinicella sp. GR2756]